MGARPLLCTRCLHDQPAKVRWRSSRAARAESAPQSPTLFAQHEARVVIHGRDTDALTAVRARIASAGSEVLTTTADLTEYDQVEAMRAADRRAPRPGRHPRGECRWQSRAPVPHRGHHRSRLSIVDRHESDRDLPDDQELPARDETTRPGQHHHDVIGGRPSAQRRLTSRLRRSEGRDRATHQRRRRPSRAVRDPSQLHQPRNDHDRPQSPADPGGGPAPA